MLSDGFDQPIEQEEDDELERGFLVDRVYGLLMKQPQDWCVRVALNSDWGAGKTSIAWDDPT
jgi:hypothetical protein